MTNRTCDRRFMRGLRILSLPAVLLPFATAGQAQTVAVPSANATVVALRFYEAGDDVPARDARTYTTRFDAGSARRIYTELEFEHPAPGQPLEFSVECTYSNEAAGVNGGPTIVFKPDPEWTGIVHSNGWGWAEPGRWTVGAYQVNCSHQGVVIAEGRFEIVPPAATIPSLNGGIRQIRFYEMAAGDYPVFEARQYASQFEAASARYVAFEINLFHAPPGRLVMVPLLCTYHRADGSEIATIDTEMQIQPDWQNAAATRAWGAAEPGSWTAGKYTVACTYDGKKVGEASFEVI